MRMASVQHGTRRVTPTLPRVYLKPSVQFHHFACFPDVPQLYVHPRSKVLDTIHFISPILLHRGLFPAVRAAAVSAWSCSEAFDPSPFGPLNIIIRGPGLAEPRNRPATFDYNCGHSDDRRFKPPVR